MSKTIIIAKKEFADLVHSRVAYFILALYVVVLLYSFHLFYHSYSVYGFRDVITSFIHGIAYDLYGYGGLLAVIMGFSSMYNEMGNKALNTMLVKPVYRDTILNGKLIGSILYMLCIFALVTLLYMSLSFIFFGNVFASIFPVFLSRLPLILLLCCLYYMAFYLISTCLFIYIKNSVLSFLLSFISWILLTQIICTSFPYYISLLFGSSASEINYMISSLSPDTMMFFIIDGSTDFISTINVYSVEVGKLVLYPVILLILCYIGFIRRDVA
jgi:ABC-2 type transport system permease protein